MRGRPWKFNYIYTSDRLIFSQMSMFKCNLFPPSSSSSSSFWDGEVIADDGLIGISNWNTFQARIVIENGGHSFQIWQRLMFDPRPETRPFVNIQSNISSHGYRPSSSLPHPPNPTTRLLSPIRLRNDETVDPKRQTLAAVHLQQ